MNVINNSSYHRPELTRRKGQLVTKNVPPYAIVAGNPARIIGWRFEKPKIEALNLIRWWNWSTDKIERNAELLYGNIDTFIQMHITPTKEELSHIIPADIMVPHTDE